MSFTSAHAHGSAHGAYARTHAHAHGEHEGACGTPPLGAALAWTQHARTPARPGWAPGRGGAWGTRTAPPPPPAPHQQGRAQLLAVSRQLRLRLLAGPAWRSRQAGRQTTAGRRRRYCQRRASQALAEPHPRTRRMCAAGPAKPWPSRTHAQGACVQQGGARCPDQRPGAWPTWTGSSTQPHYSCSLPEVVPGAGSQCRAMPGFSPGGVIRGGVLIGKGTDPAESGLAWGVGSLHMHVGCLCMQGRGDARGGCLCMQGRGEAGAGVCACKAGAEQGGRSKDT